MRLVIARCRVDYTGRLSAHLPLATRLLVVKADGSVLVHSDGGSYKPLNWMSPPCTMVEVDPDEAQAADGVEAHLQRLLAEHIHTLGHGWSLVRREYMTAIGPVDILAKDSTGTRVAV